MTINNKYNMKDGQTFIISYTKKDGEKVTRNGKFILGKCGEWVSKAGNKLLHILMQIKAIIWVEINTVWLKIIGRSNNGKLKTRNHKKENLSLDNSFVKHYVGYVQCV